VNNPKPRPRWRLAGLSLTVALCLATLWFAVFHSGEKAPADTSADLTTANELVPVQAEHGDFLPDASAAEDEEAEEKENDEEPGQSDPQLFGQVVEAGSLKPVAGALVRAIEGVDATPGGLNGWFGDHETPTPFTTRTDADGLFSIPVPEDQRFLHVSHPSFASAYASATWEKYKSAEQRQRIELVRARSGLHLTVSQGNAPLVDAAVAVSGSPVVENEWGERLSAEVRTEACQTDIQGLCTFPDLPSATQLTVLVTGPGRVNYKKVLKPLAMGEVRLEQVQVPNRRLEGQVVDASGRPVDGCQVLVFRKDTVCSDARSSMASVRSYHLKDSLLSATCDAGGAFGIEGIDVGTFWLAAWPSSETENISRNKSEDAFAQRVVIAATDSTVHVSLVLPPVKFISGVVRRQDSGRPVALAFVTAINMVNQCVEATSSTDDDGSFSVGPLVEGDYAVRAKAQQDWVEHADGGAVTVAAGATGVQLTIHGEARPAPTLENTSVLKLNVVSPGVSSRAEAMVVPSSFLERGAAPRRNFELGEPLTIGSLRAGLYRVDIVTADGFCGRALGVRATDKEDLGTPEAVTLQPCAKLRVAGCEEETFVNLCHQGGCYSFSKFDARDPRVLFLIPGETIAVRGLWDGDPANEVEHRFVLVPGEQTELRCEP
jgi:Carboxypeptidase regulatory-like domain